MEELKFCLMHKDVPVCAVTIDTASETARWGAKYLIHKSDWLEKRDAFGNFNSSKRVNCTYDTGFAVDRPPGKC